MKNRGRFFLFEGIDGSGKTTLSKLVADNLQSLGHEAKWHREPTDGPHGRELRSFLSGQLLLEPESEWELFQKDREESVTEMILPTLRKGIHIIQDRYFYSTAAYQGGRSKTPEEILKLSLGFPKPDMIFYLQITPEEAEGRRKKRGMQKEAFDDLEEQRRIAKNYSIVLPQTTIYLPAKEDLNYLNELALSHILEFLDNI